MTIKNDSCGPDDPGQDYIDCPNCAAGRVYSLECDCCGWQEGDLENVSDKLDSQEN